MDPQQESTSQSKSEVAVVIVEISCCIFGKGDESRICRLSLFLDFALNAQLLGLKLIRKGANNLIDGLYSWDFV
uniref:Uncharacterized protein n=1 Tax=Romanomermis culicivorax TaxID=13658 RepID=A0A915IQ16_ROMCU